MRPRLRNGSALLALSLLALAHCATRRDATENVTLDGEFQNALLESYVQSDVVAHVKIVRTETADTLFSDDGTPGYFLNSVSAEVVESYKGEYPRASLVLYTFQSDLGVKSHSQWTPGREWVVFLTRNRETDSTLSCGEMPCQTQATDVVLRLMAQLREQSP